MKKLTIAICSGLCLFFTACSSSKAPARKAEEKPAEPITGQSALYKMYQPARAWAGDVQVLKLSSIEIPEVKSTPGKAGAWQATFVSPSKGKARSWTFSVVESSGNLHKGPFAGPEEGWSGPRGINQTFPIIAVRTDTDAVYKTALTKAADYAKKNPNKPIMFLLEKTDRHPDAAWRVVWGESLGTSNFSIFVDASTGLYLETMR
ncbi:MAG: hypothetical protein M1436_00740 [Acidobacteria bacterium]|nr:hypothetical protein [Acidobacteriota bacterium]